jgi:NADH-quinone oxidoreductase subunit M
MPLSILIWLPAAAALVGAIFPWGRAPGRYVGPHISVARWFAVAGSLGALAIAVGEIVAFNPAHHGLTHVTDQVWISSLGIHYKLGLDGLNLFLIGLATLLFAAATLSASMRAWSRPGLFYFHLGLAETAVLGAFLAQDLLLLLAAQQHGGHITFVLSDLAKMPLGKGSQEWIFLCFAAAFLVKMPAFPLHGWMPDGYRAMPIEVLAVFSGVLSKVGAYGFLRIVLPLYPAASVHFQTLMLLIGLASILYGSVMAFTQSDARLVVGYSSVAQLGFITLGIFALNPQGAQGALLQMLNHGLVTAPLIFIIALLAARAGGSEDIRDMGGIAFRAPVLAALFLIVALATLAMPGSSNFVGEFLILLGVFNAKLVIAIVAFAGVVMASVYALRLFIRAMHNRAGPEVESYDISYDGLVLVPLVAVILYLALYPQLALRRSEATVRAQIAPAQTLAGSASGQSAVASTGVTP